MKRLEKARKEKNSAQEQLQKLKTKLKESTGNDRLLSRINTETKRMREADRDEKDIIARIRSLEKAREAQKLDSSNEKHINESQRDYLIRTGKITPFTNTLEENNIILPGSQHTYTYQNLRKSKSFDQMPSIESQNEKKRKAKGLSDDDYSEDEDDNMSNESNDYEVKEEGDLQTKNRKVDFK
ncbi:hypothetical protein BY458DRAFT_44017 [Sporodiniella umbellata]|nr:hypothetical protein BY458DRAFT_44017 [Sporodiniella umbellata]